MPATFDNALANQLRHVAPVRDVGGTAVQAAAADHGTAETASCNPPPGTSDRCSSRQDRRQHNLPHACRSARESSHGTPIRGVEAGSSPGWWIPLRSGTAFPYWYSASSPDRAHMRGRHTHRRHRSSRQASGSAFHRHSSRCKSPGNTRGIPQGDTAAPSGSPHASCREYGSLAGSSSVVALSRRCRCLPLRSG